MKNKIDFIQGLRGFACLAVVLYHGSYWTGSWAKVTQEIFFAAGYFGVSLFFVISGFIMVITTKKSDGSLSFVKKFITKRFLRIWPAYLVATVVSFIMLEGFVWFENKDNLIALFKSVFFVPSGKDPAPTFGAPVLPVGWTLTYEIIFYAIFAVSMLAAKFRWVVFYSISALLLVVVPYTTRGYFSLSPTFDYGFSSIALGLFTSPMIWMFVAGVVIGQIYLSGLTIKSEKLCWMLVFFTFSFTLAQYVSGSRIGHGLMEWGTSIIPLMLCLTVVSKTVHIKTPSFLIYLGDISFSLYLIHVLMQGVTLHGLVYFGLGGFAQGISSLIMTSCMSVIAAGIFYKYVESYFAKGVFVKKSNNVKMETVEPVRVSTPAI